MTRGFLMTLALVLASCGEPNNDTRVTEQAQMLTTREDASRAAELLTADVRRICVYFHDPEYPGDATDFIGFDRSQEAQLIDIVTGEGSHNVFQQSGQVYFATVGVVGCRIPAELSITQCPAEHCLPQSEYVIADRRD